MPKKFRKTKQEGTPGLIKTTQKAANSVKTGVKGFLYGRDPEVSPGKTAEQNRNTGEKIIASLQIAKARFYDLKEKGKPEDRERYDEMQKSVQALIENLQNAPTILDDIKELDTILLNTADTLGTAIEMNYIDQADWCISALSMGMAYLRNNIPPERQEKRDEIIEERIEYMGNYEKLIKLSGKMAETKKSMDSLKETITKLKNEFTPQYKELENLKKTNEGLYIFNRIKRFQNEPDELQENEKKVLHLLKETASLKASIIRASGVLDSENESYRSSAEMAQEYRNNLAQRPGLYSGEDFAGDYKVILEKANQRANKALIDAATVSDMTETENRKLRAIMNGEAAQKLAVRGAKMIDDIMEQKNRITAREEEEFRRSVRKMKQAELEAEQAEVRRQELMREIQEEISGNTNKNDDINFSTNEVSETTENVDNSILDENTNTSDNEDDNINYTTYS